MAQGERMTLAKRIVKVAPPGFHFLPGSKWIWYVFGHSSDPNAPELLTVALPFDPPLWRRILTRIFLGSVWERIK